eukprot:1139646-Pelagomonas_calceolata.AAC.3
MHKGSTGKNEAQVTAGHGSGGSTGEEQAHEAQAEEHVWPGMRKGSTGKNEAQVTAGHWSGGSTGEEQAREVQAEEHVWPGMHKGSTGDRGQHCQGSVQRHLQGCEDNCLTCLYKIRTNAGTARTHANVHTHKHLHRICQRISKVILTLAAGHTPTS